MERKIVICPTAGMCNRLRSISSILCFAEKNNINPYIFWNKSENTNNEQQVYMRMQDRSFTDFFLPNLTDATINNVKDIDCIITEWIPTDGWYKSQSDGQKNWLNKGTNTIKSLTKCLNIIPDISNKNNILIETSLKIEEFIIENARYKIFDNERHKMYKKYLIPRDEYKNYISNFLLKNSISSIDIGISIRVGEFQKYFPRDKYMFAPGNIFLERFLDRIMLNNNTIIIFSDDHDLRDKLNNILLSKYDTSRVLILDRNILE